MTRSGGGDQGGGGWCPRGWAGFIGMWAGFDGCSIDVTWIVDMVSLHFSQVRINMLHVASDADSDPDQDQNLIMILFVYEKAKLETSRSSWGRVSHP